MTTNKNQDQPLRELFDEALERADRGERARFLDQACGADLELRQRVEKLLGAHEEAGGFLSHPSQRPDSGGQLTEKPGDRIGRYKLLQQIGEGGCGAVYMAEQEEPVRRNVALKIIKLGMDTKQVVARFEAERQALALMEHPNIAQVLDAGATESGRPFFVMELVRGVKITKFCDERQLSTRERLELFMQVCSAIQHAHHKGIIHRDLKPSNILVTMLDGARLVKVIDFGIAKATTNQRLTDKTVFTAFDQFIGTPAYMSPEQAEMSGADVDTRTDIYSLGVVLYELLTGKPPFETEDLVRAGLDEMRRTIREREPAQPSTRLAHLSGEEATTVAQERKTELPTLLKVVRGDLDWIVMKCLEKDRNRRYETASGLAADIERHLGGEPVLACPPSNLYRFRKLVGRHRAVSALSAVLLLSLLVGGVMLWRSERGLRRAFGAEQKSRAREIEALHASLLGQARAQRQSGRIGQRFDTLETVRRAAQIRPSLELRNVAAAALAQPDLRRVRDVKCYYADKFSTVDFSPDFTYYVCGSPTGFGLRATSNSISLRTFAGTGGRGADFVGFSSDGRWIAVGDVDRNFEIWSVEGTKPVSRRRATKRDVLIPAFRPDGTGFACVSASGQVCLRRFDSEEGQTLTAVGGGRVAMSFSPDGGKLAVAHSGVLELWDLGDATRKWSLELEVSSLQPAWRADGKFLAVGEFGNNGLVLVQAADGKVERTFYGHSLPVVYAAFHPNGQVLASVGADRCLRFWNIHDGTEILRCPAAPRGVRFSQDGRLVGFAPEDGTAAVFEMAPEAPCREFFGQPKVAYVLEPACQVSPDGRLVVTTDGRETRLWDTRAERQVAAFETDSLRRELMQFEPGRQALVYNVSSPARPKSTTSATFRLVRRDYHWIEKPGQNPLVELGPEQPLSPDAAIHLHDITPDGKLWLLHRTQQAWVAWPEGRRESEKILAHQPGFTEAEVTLSPDGRWLVGGKGKRGAHIWDTTAGRWAASLVTDGSCDIVFTPDGRWLLLGDAQQYRAWEVGTWRLMASWPANLPNAQGHVSPSPDSKLVALDRGDGRLRLVSLSTWQEVVTLELPSDVYVERAAWSPDGQKLFVLGARQRLFVWDLPGLRKELAALGLDWKD